MRKKRIGKGGSDEQWQTLENQVDKYVVPEEDDDEEEQEGVPSRLDAVSCEGEEERLADNEAVINELEAELQRETEEAAENEDEDEEVEEDQVRLAPLSVDDRREGCVLLSKVSLIHAQYILMLS